MPASHPARKPARKPAARKTAERSHPAARATSTTKQLTARKATAKAKAPTSAPRAPRTPAAPDAIALLRADHKLVDGLFEQFDKMKGDGPKKKALVERICNELTVHTQIEEEIFYPTVRPLVKDGDLMDEAVVEHAGAKELIAQLRTLQPGEEMYDAKVTVLSEYIKHHVKEEHTEMFPKVKKTKLDLNALGAKMMERKQELMAGIARIEAQR